tara:strand:+ start:675 stop:4025 length:3351 start_codon:yes stop_codon:yes gene_type:complete
MTKNIFEEESTSENQASGGDAKIRKQARQLAYDVRYKVKQSLSKGEESNDASLKRAYLQQLNSSPAPGAVKRVAKKMLVGESYDFVDITETAKESVDKILSNVFVKKIDLEDADGNPTYEVTNLVFGEEKSDREKKYKVRVTGKKGNKTYVRMADRKDIDKLRKGDDVSSVEMTGYGVPNEEKGKKKVVKKAKKDFDGDGKLESPEAEYKGSKDKAIKKAVAKEGYQRDPEKLKKDKTHSKQPDPSKDGFTGIGNMSIKDIMKMNKKMKKEEVEVVDEANKGERVADPYRAGKLSARPVGKRASKKSRTTAWTTADVGQRNRRRFDKRHGGDGSRKLNKFGSDYRVDKREGNSSESSDHAQKQRRAEHQARRGVKTKGVKEEFQLEGYYDSAVAASKAASKSNKPKVSLKDRIKSVAKKAITSTSHAAGKAVKVKSDIQAAPGKAKKKVTSYVDRVKGVAKAAYKSGRGPVKTTSYRGAGVGRKEKIGEDNIQSMLDYAWSLSLSEHHQKDAEGKVIEHGDGTPSSVEEGLVDIVKKGAKRHAKAVEKKKIKNRKAVPYAALAAEHEPEGEIIEDYYRGTGEKVVARTKKWMKKKGQEGAPGLDAMKARTAEHKAKRGVKEDFVTEVIEKDNPDANVKKIDVMKGKNKVKINPNMGEQLETDVKDAKDDQKSKQATMLKKRVLMQKLKAVRAGAGDSITASHMPEGEVVEAAGCETKKIENKGKKTVDPKKNPVVEAKVEQGRSDYGKASVRNKRAFGIEGEPEATSGSKERGKMIDARRYRHRTKRGIKKSDYKIDEGNGYQPEIEHSKLGDAKKKADKKRESKLPPHLQGDAIGKMKKAFSQEAYRVLARDKGDKGRPAQFSYKDENDAKKFADSIKSKGGKATVAKEENALEKRAKENEKARKWLKKDAKDSGYTDIALKASMSKGAGVNESHATAKKPSERAAIAKLEAILKRKEDLKKQTKGVKEEVVGEALGAAYAVGGISNAIAAGAKAYGASQAAKGAIIGGALSGAGSVVGGALNYAASRNKKSDSKKKKSGVKEEADAYKYVVSKLKKKYGSGVLTKGDKIKPQSAADKAKARAHQAKVDAENAAERKKDPSQGRYPKGYSNRGSD